MAATSPYLGMYSDTTFVQYVPYLPQLQGTPATLEIVYCGTSGAGAIGLSGLSKDSMSGLNHHGYSTYLNIVLQYNQQPPVIHATRADSKYR